MNQHDHFWNQLIDDTQSVPHLVLLKMVSYSSIVRVIALCVPQMQGWLHTCRVEVVLEIPWVFVSRIDSEIIYVHASSNRCDVGKEL